MEARNFLLAIAISTILTFTACIKCQSDVDHEDHANDTTPELEIPKYFNLIPLFSYGEKCSWEWELKVKEFQEEMKQLMTEIFPPSQYGVAGNCWNKIEDFRLPFTSSEEDAWDSLRDKSKEIYKRLNESKNEYEFHGICNHFKGLHCDQEIGECRCGDFGGSSLVDEDGNCKLDFGSSCLHSEYSKYSDVECRKESVCVTGIENLECTLENSSKECVKNPSRFSQMMKYLGGVCYCEKVGNRDSKIPGRYSESRFFYSGSIQCAISESLMSAALVMLFGKQYI